MSQKGGFQSQDGQALTPASVSSVDTASQQASHSDASASVDPKTEVKQQQDEEDDGEEGCSKGGKLSNVKMENKPIKMEGVKKEECGGQGGKGVPMETSSSSGVKSEERVKMEDRKPEVKKEPKEEEKGSDSPGISSGAQNKKKSKDCFILLMILLRHMYYVQVARLYTQSLLLCSCRVIVGF